MNQCRECGLELAPHKPGRGRSPCYCSKRCRDRGSSERRNKRAERLRNCPLVCACGQPRSRAAVQCKACETQARRRPFVCEWCGGSFWRRSNRGDTRRFCSKRCSGARRTAIAAAKREIDRHEREIERAIDRANRPLLREARQRLRALRRCACGAPVASIHGVVCAACAAANRRAGHRRARRWSRIVHCCPSCGNSFFGLEHDVYCSSRCGHQLRKGRYPSIGGLPLEERNRIAEFIALVRAAHKQMQGEPNSGVVSLK